MRTLRLLLAIAAALPLAAQTAPGKPITPAKKIKLFNGKNLDGWYGWLREHKYEDPDHVFSVEKGQIKISGTEWGGLTTKNEYRDYHLTVEWKWGGPAYAARAKAARDSGIMLHGRGPDGGYNGVWLQSVECQIIEGGTGDILMVGKDMKPEMTVMSRAGEGKEIYFDEGGKPVRKDTGRFNWWGRDPKWTDTIDFRGPKDLDKKAGEWNRIDVYCDKDEVAILVNGVLANYGTKSSWDSGKIQFESEGAEIWIRKVDLEPIPAGYSAAKLPRRKQ